MFETLAMARKALDEAALCAQGICSSVPKSLPGVSIADSAPHIAKDGLYSADIIKEYRKCSNDYKTIFSVDKKSRGVPLADAKYDDTRDGKLEQFRVCWETIDVSQSYDVSPYFK